MIRHSGSYAVTLLAVIIGTVVGGLLGAFISDYLPVEESLGMLLLSAIGGAMLGSSLVTWGLLRVCEYPGAGLTGVLVGGAWLLFVGLLFTMSEQGMLVLWILPLVACGLCGAARALALRV